MIDLSLNFLGIVSLLAFELILKLRDFFKVGITLTQSISQFLF